MKLDYQVRKLTEEERGIYGGAVIRAVELIPAFRDAVALIRPFYDPLCTTAYTDAFARVGLSEWFFKDLTPYQRASVILHECMHVLNSHIIRGEELGNQGKLMNYAGDFEINCGLNTLPRIDLKFAIFPDRAPYSYKPFLSMEQYFHMLKRDFDKPCPQHGPGGSDEKNESDTKDEAQGEGGEQGEKGDGSQDDQSQQNPSEGGDSNQNGEGQESSEGANGSSSGDGAGEGEESAASGGGESSSSSSSGGSSSSSGKNAGPCTCDPNSGKKQVQGNACDDATEERSAAADGAGIERASEIEQTLAKKNTNARIVEELSKGKSMGDGEMHDFLSLAQRLMQPPKVSWQSILRRVFSKMNDAVIRGRADYSYRRVNRRSHGSEFIFPGMVQYMPTVMFGIDTSGSMSTEDYNNLLNEVEGILKALSKGKDALRVFTIDTTVKNISPVSSVKQIKLYGGGGTDMSVGWKYVNSLPKKKKPDIFVLATDGYTDWARVEEQVMEGERLYRSIILITNKGGFQTVPESLRQKTVVIDVS